jgi:hypothetical protein
MANIETFNVDEDFMQDFDYDIIDDLAMGVLSIHGQCLVQFQHQAHHLLLKALQP